ncbi:uncharacterized protein FMAN_10938 [Fusarium mangiferae]|uniref:ER-bound oxygenase mpaB/mpaB'/Rubber oxygenase catalytic domain-containing protein n=1 Tax=Fusarium mangiferae TaxID=192010 RepID=A0A1L7TMU2_FUSMA|nr:uncharacterized protein FMAN_10938 [Fusarium mangiferae]CVK96607.1 uncharacterized protein FMAN_10938 [Fusarium mangiferae]
MYILLLTTYVAAVRYLRFRRRDQILAALEKDRPLSSMTVPEAHNIMMQLQELEFPYAFRKARTISLLKAGGIPTMSKLFAVTGQNNARNGGKRAVDTEILIREVQHNSRLSSRYQTAIARMNYLHSRYRQAGKILDEDLLHTLGSSIVEIFRIFESEEWRPLSEVEKCAVGVVHMALGQDMEIPFNFLPSSSAGWRDGIHFATELRDWTLRYEANVALPTEANDRYVRVYVDGIFPRLTTRMRMLLRKTIGSELDSVMRESLGIESAGPVLTFVLSWFKTLRRLALRYLSLPRPAFLASKSLAETPNPETGLYNLTHFSAEPWYTRSNWWTTHGPRAQMIRVLGGKLPESVLGKFKPQGYDLMTIGPQPQEGKGMDSMAATISGLQSQDLSTCPFKRFKS